MITLILLALVIAYFVGLRKVNTGASARPALFQRPYAPKALAAALSTGVAAIIYLRLPAYLRGPLYWFLIVGPAGFVGALAADSLVSALWAIFPAVLPAAWFFFVVGLESFYANPGLSGDALARGLNTLGALVGGCYFALLIAWCAGAGIVGFNLRRAVLGRRLPIAEFWRQSGILERFLMLGLGGFAALIFTGLAWHVRTIRRIDLDSVVDQLATAGDTRVVAEKELESRGDEAVPALARGLNKPGIIPDECARVLVQIQPLDPAIAPAIAMKAREPKEFGHRMDFIWVLSRIRSERAIAEVRRFVREDPSPYVRAHALWLLAGLRKQPADSESFYRSILNTDPSLEVQLEAYAALADPAGHEIAVKVLNGDFSSDEEGAALHVIEVIADPADIPLLDKLAPLGRLGPDNIPRDVAFKARLHIKFMRLSEPRRLLYLLASLGGPNSSWAIEELSHRFDPVTTLALEMRALSPGEGASDAQWALHLIAMNK